MDKRCMSALRTCAALIVIFFAISCERGPQRRPAGFLRLGNLAELLERAELRDPALRDSGIFFSDLGILLRRDEGGLYAMSTHCTFNRTALSIQEVEGKKVLSSRYSASSYDIFGNVLTGPTRHPLPYYVLQLEPWTAGGPPDTLFVLVGRERPREWRLPVGAS